MKTILSKLLLTVGSCLLGMLVLRAQQIVYSEQDIDNPTNIRYDIIGKMNGQFIIYKNEKNKQVISTYDLDMKQVNKTYLSYIPDGLLSIDFLLYPDYLYCFYQYQRKKTVYIMAVKLDGVGKKLSDPILVDTTDINYATNNRVYSFLKSENKKYLLFYKSSTNNSKEHFVTTVILDNSLSLIQKSRILLSMEDRTEFENEYQLDNEGNIVAILAKGSSQNDNINKITLLTKPLQQKEFQIHPLTLNNVYLDDIKLKVDNKNHKYLVTSFYSNKRRGSVDGLYASMWDRDSAKETYSITTIFPTSLREDAKGEGGLKTAFDDYYLRHIIMRNDKGFLIVSELELTSSRGGNNPSRWDYLNGGGFWSPSNYYSNNSAYYPWSRNSYSVTRYYADNILVISFDGTGKMEWSNVLQKSQFDDNTDNYISYGLCNSGDKIHFIFNQMEKRQTLLVDQSITPLGEQNRSSTLKNLDKGYDFLPRHAKQVGLRQLIIPCEHGNFLCFAKVDF